MDLEKIILNRRSIRKYTGEKIEEKTIEKILRAGLAAPTSHGRRSWEFIVVRDKETLQKLSVSRKCGAGMLAQADCAIVVVADAEKTDVWTEDASIAMAYMHLMADSLGVGSCWIQGRLRTAPDGRTTEETVREILGFPDNYKLEAMLSLGIAEEQKEPQASDSLPTEKIHKEIF